MECTECKRQNQPDSKFCVECGTLLAPIQWPAGEFRAYLRREIVDTVHDEFKDQKTVEIETTQAIAERLAGWAKLLWAFVGIPVGVLLFVIAFLGVKSYSDFSSKVAQAQSEVTKRLERAKVETDSLLANLEKRKTALAKLDVVSEELKALETKVRRIEEKITFDPSLALTPQLQSKIQKSLDSFQKYMVTLGYKPTTSKTTVWVDPDLKNNVYYEGARNRIVLGAPFADDTDAMFREYTHHALFDSLGKWAAESTNNTFNGVESGLADYFACSFNNDPIFGEEFAAAFKKLNGENSLPNAWVRNLQNDRKLSAIQPETELHEIGEIWGAVFWDIRQQLGQAEADTLLFAAWKGLTPDDLAEDISNALARKILAVQHSQHPGKGEKALRDIFGRRGLKL
jgi:hypothetical protein